MCRKLILRAYRTYLNFAGPPKTAKKNKWLDTILCQGNRKKLTTISMRAYVYTLSIESLQSCFLSAGLVVFSEQQAPRGACREPKLAQDDFLEDYQSPLKALLEPFKDP